MMSRLSLLGLSLLLGCSANAAADRSPTPLANEGTAGAGGTGGSTGGTGSALNVDAGGSSGGTQAYCDKPGPDADADGFNVDQGDCNDCDANANPGALDVAGNDIDEDCNGTADDTVVSCDDALAVASTDAADAARAIGLCHFATETDSKWGVLSAKYVLADGSPGMSDTSHGLLPGFGPNVKAPKGARLLALSSGTARQPNDSGYEDVGGYDTGTVGTTPTGFPKDSPACGGVSTASDTTAYNPAALELQIRVPTNAKSFRFAFDFYTYEFPSFVCTDYNDFFVALQDPPSPNAQSGNISFDSQGNPVSVNNGFLEVCAAQEAGGKTFPCILGTKELDGTGFTDSAATGWLETQSPVEPGTIVTLRFAVWDMGDPVLDSSVLLDGFEFSAEPAKESVTKPLPVPK